MDGQFAMRHSLPFQAQPHLKKQFNGKKEKGLKASGQLLV